MADWSKSKTTLVLILILATAIFFRFYHIKETPPGLYPDEAVNGVNALTANRDHDWKIFYTENNGREGLFMNLQSISIRFFGAEPWALRVVSGVFGVLTVLGLFFLVRLLWGRRAGLVASYLIAVSFWAVNFSRIGFRAIMLPFILIWTFYFLWLGILKKNIWLAGLAGFIYGLGFHTYISWRLSPFLVIILFLCLLAGKKFDRRFILKAGIIFVLLSIIAAAPLLWYFTNNKADFLGRASEVSIFTAASPSQALLGSIIKTLGMFNILGDGNWRHNFSGRPELFWPVGIGFLAGWLYLIKKPEKNEAGSKITNYFPIFWLLILLTPNFLAPEGAPHALRALGAMPAAFIITTLGMLWIYDTFKNRFRQPKLWAIIFLIFVGVWEGTTYFVFWANKPEVASNFEQRLTDIGRYLKNENQLTAKYVIVNDNALLVGNVPIQAQPIIFLNFGAKNITYLKASDLKLLPPRLTNAIIVPTKKDPAIITQLLNKYPQADLKDLNTFEIIEIK